MHFQHHNEFEEAHRDNIAQLLEEHSDKWDEKKGGAWWAEDFMAYHRIWWTDFQKDLKAMLRGITPKRLDDLEELKKYMLAYIKPKLIKPGGKARNTPSPKKDKPTVAPGQKVATPAPKVDDIEAQKIIDTASSKNEAMSRLRQKGFSNKEIAAMMGLKPGRVASGIGAFDKKGKQPTHNLW